MRWNCRERTEGCDLCNTILFHGFRKTNWKSIMATLLRGDNQKQLIFATDFSWAGRRFVFSKIPRLPREKRRNSSYFQICPTCLQTGALSFVRCHHSVMQVVIKCGKMLTKAEKRRLIRLIPFYRNLLFSFDFARLWQLVINLVSRLLTEESSGSSRETSYSNTSV